MATLILGGIEIEKLIGIIVALIGVTGVVVGVLFTELIRRFNRVEMLNDKIFNERLNSYINLYKKINKINFEINSLIKMYENGEINESVWKSKIKSINLNLAKYFDLNDFFFSEELIIHCVSIYFGLDEMTFENIEEYKQRITKTYKIAKEIIKNESGINKVNKGHKKIIRYNHKSPIIGYFHKLKNKK